MSKLTPFHAQLSAMTDKWMDLFGYAAPSVVSSTREEYRACREAAALMDFSMLRKVYLDGVGAEALVDSVVCRDLSTLPPDRIAYGALTNENGKMVDDCTVMVLAPDRVQFCGANDADYAAFSVEAEGGPVRVSERTDEIGHLCLQGPLSRQILQPLTASDLSNEAFPYYTYRTGVHVSGIPVFMTRLGYTAELGYELWVEADRAPELWDALIAAGSSRGMRVLGMDALDLLRIEGGFIIGGVEYDETVSPYECGLGWSVALDKERFRGREALAADRETVRRRLVSLKLDTGGAAASGAKLSTAEEKSAGLVTQAIESPLLGGDTLALGQVDRDYAAGGTQLNAEVDGAFVGATVVSHPVYDPERRRAKEL